MNKIILDKEKKMVLKEDTYIEIKDKDIDLDISIENDIRVFILIESSNINLNINQEHDLVFNIFSFDSSLNVKLDILKDNLNTNYGYSTINENNNTYNIDIDHLGKNINSTIKNHGINNSSNKLDFIVNTFVPIKKDGIKTYQDSKIITNDNESSSIKPNLYIDNDDIEAEHSAYIGKFKEDEIFYLLSRGLTRRDAINLLVKAFLMGNMNLDFEEKDIITKQIKRFWR